MQNKLNKTEAHTMLSDAVKHHINEANIVNRNIIRLVITLSSSFLLLTMAVVEKIFPNVLTNQPLPESLIISWSLLILAIITGIFAKINEYLFFTKTASEYIKKRHSLEDASHYIYKDKGNTLTSNSIVPSFVCVVSFLFAISFLCATLLKKFMSVNLSDTILLYALVIITALALYFLSKRHEALNPKLPTDA